MYLIFPLFLLYDNKFLSVRYFKKTVYYFLEQLQILEVQLYWQKNKKNYR